jgi:hypothetical protein
MAQITDAPQNLTMIDFMGYSSLFGSLAKSNRFIVRISPTGSLLSGVNSLTRDLIYLCSITDMPGRAFNLQAARYYGPTFAVPFQTVYQSVDFTFLCRNRSYEREFFDNWMTLINPINTYDFNYRDEYAAEIDIFQFGEAAAQGSNDLKSEGGGAATAPEAHYKITLQDAYPYDMHPQPMTWADTDFQTIVISFTYMKWVRKGLDPVAGSGKGGYSYNLVEGRTIVNPRVR